MSDVFCCVFRLSGRIEMKGGMVSRHVESVLMGLTLGFMNPVCFREDGFRIRSMAQWSGGVYCARAYCVSQCCWPDVKIVKKPYYRNLHLAKWLSKTAGIAAKDTCLLRQADITICLNANMVIRVGHETVNGRFRSWIFWRTRSVMTFANTISFSEQLDFESYLIFDT